MQPWKEYALKPLSYPNACAFFIALLLIVFATALTTRVALAQPNVVAWGSNSSGQTSVPQDLTNAVAIAAGYSHSAALRADGTVVCWGLNTSGQTNVPAGLSNVVAISCGQNHTLALTSDGTIVAWGGPASALPPANLSNVVAVAGTFSASFALFSDGSIQFWPTNASTPSIVGNAMNLGSRCSGNGVAVGTTVNGALLGVSTGQNPGNFVSVLYPNGPALTIDGRVKTYNYTQYVDTGLSNIVAISVGFNWPGLALRTDGTIYNGLASISNAVAIASGNSHSLALLGVGGPVFSTRSMSLTINPGRLARLYATATGQWPISYQWQFNGADIPGATTPMLAVSNVTTANFGAYQLVATNTLGANTSAPVTLALLPIAGVDLTPNVTDVVSIASSSTDGHFLALKRDGTVLAWGLNDVGQCNVPTGLSNVISISSCSGVSTRLSHSLALTASGTIYSWGKNYFTNTWPTLTNIGMISAGGYYDAALTTPEGALATWSPCCGLSPAISASSKNLAAVASSRDQTRPYVTVGVDGLAHTGDLTTPAGISNFISAARGDSFCVGLRADGGVVAWGLNNLGQTNVPASLTNAVQVTTLGSTCGIALKDDGTLSAWGSVPASVSNLITTASNVVLLDGPTALIGTGAPFILDRGIDRALAPGGQVFFRSVATGERPLHYQWQFNGTDLPGQTASILHLTNLSISQSGDYSVVVSNTHGIATSFPSHLTVFDYAQALGSSNVIWTSFGDSIWFVQTNVTKDGVSAVQSGPVSYGGTAQQSVLRGIFNGPGTLSFWWKVSSNPGFDTLAVKVNGATFNSISGEWGWQLQTMLLGAGPQTVDFVFQKTSPLSGPYQNAGWVDDLTFTPGVTLVSILSQPKGVAQAPGADVGFSISTMGTPPTSYQWMFNGQNVSGWTNASITLRNVQSTNEGVYSCLVSNMGGPLLSSNASLVLGRVAEWGGLSPLTPSVTNAAALAAGLYHGLALQPDGMLLGWGNNVSGQINIPSTLTNITSIGAGAWFSMAISGPDGTLVAWGDNAYGQSTVPSGLNNVLMAAGGFYHASALRSDGTVVCWGRNEYGQTNVPPDLTNAVQIAVAGEHNTALRADGTIVCWGQNTYGETNVPPGLADVVSVRAGFNHSLALKSDGTVVVWGNTNSSLHLFDIPANLTNAISIAAGGEYNLALNSSGQSAWWGLDRTGGASIPSALTNLVSITAGGYFSVGLVGDSIPSPAVPIRQPVINNGHFEVSAATINGRVYRLEYKNSLTDPAWQSLPLRAGIGAEQVFADLAPAAGQRYYRLRSW